MEIKNSSSNALNNVEPFSPIKLQFFCRIQMMQRQGKNYYQQKMLILDLTVSFQYRMPFISLKFWKIFICSEYVLNSHLHPSFNMVRLLNCCNALGCGREHTAPSHIIVKYRFVCHSTWITGLVLRESEEGTNQDKLS